jgi:hypothetical protein
MSIPNAPVRILGCGSPLMGNDGAGLKVIEALHTTEILIVKPTLWQEYGNAKGNPGDLRECKYPEAF